MASPQTFEAGTTRQPAESASCAFSKDHSTTVESMGFRTGRFHRRPLALAQPRARHHSTAHSPPLPYQLAHPTAAIGYAPINPYPDHPTSNGHSQSYSSSRAYHLVRRPTQRLPIRVGSNPQRQASRIDPRESDPARLITHSDACTRVALRPGHTTATHHPPMMGLLDAQPASDRWYPRHTTNGLAYTLFGFHMVSSGYHIYLERS